MSTQCQYNINSLTNAKKLGALGAHAPSAPTVPTPMHWLYMYRHACTFQGLCITIWKTRSHNGAHNQENVQISLDLPVLMWLDAYKFHWYVLPYTVNRDTPLWRINLSILALPQYIYNQWANNMTQLIFTPRHAKYSETCTIQTNFESSAVWYTPTNFMYIGSSK